MNKNSGNKMCLHKAVKMIWFHGPRILEARLMRKGAEVVNGMLDFPQKLVYVYKTLICFYINIHNYL